MNTLFQSLLIVVGSAILSVAGLLLTRKILGPDNLKNHHELASNILAVVGTLNAVLLGLVILEAQSRFQQARTNEAAESSAVGDLRMYAEYLPEPTRGLINRHVGTYVKLVREVEWDSPPAMQPNKEAVKEIHCIWKLVCDFNPATSKEQNLQASMLTSLTQAFDMRRFRITTGRHGIPPILWSVLIVGSISTIVFTYYLSGHTLKMHIFMVVLLSLPLSMGILVVHVLGNPYVGDWKIRPEQYLRITTGRLPITSDANP